MNYEHEFSRLRAVVADCSFELRAFVEQLAHAPIWDDRAACICIADWSERLEAAHEEYFPISHVEQLRVAALAELRGEGGNSQLPISNFQFIRTTGDRGQAE